MLQTLYARAKESMERGAIHDVKAVESVQKLDYDFSLADKDVAMRSGVIARTLVLARLTTAWLSGHPGAVVVNLACGLDTRCYRVQGYCHWDNPDLPQTIAVRKRLLPQFRFVQEHSLIEGMAEFVPIYKVLQRLPFVRGISNKVVVLEKSNSSRSE